MLIKVPVFRILAALTALQALDATDETGKRRFKFTKVMFRMSLAAKMRKFADIKKDVEEARTKTAQDLGIKGDGKDDPEDVRKFSDELKLLYNTEQEVDITQIRRDDLELEKNDIQSGAIADLDWLIDDKDKEPA